MVYLELQKCAQNEVFFQFYSGDIQVSIFKFSLNLAIIFLYLAIKRACLQILSNFHEKFENVLKFKTF
jgi:hypothetical protein